MPKAVRGIPWWWPLVISVCGIALAFFEAYHNYENWPVTGLAGSMILGGIPAWALDSWIRGKGNEG